MQHGTIRRKEPRKVAAGNVVDSAVGHRNQEKRSRHRLGPRRINSSLVHNSVGAEGKNEHRKQPGKHGADTSKSAVVTPVVSVYVYCLSGVHWQSFLRINSFSTY